MEAPGRFAHTVLDDGGVVEFWDGGDPRGRPVLYHPGTPSCRVLGVWAHEAAAAAGVRLIGVSRPGYGGSTPLPAPSLAKTAGVTAGLAASLGIDGYAIAGVSGGGPHAAASAVVDPDHVRVLAVLAGIGPWTDLDPASDETAEEWALVQRHGAGDLGAADEYRAFAEREFAPLRDLGAEDRVRAFMQAFESPLIEDPTYFAIWAENLAIVVAGLEGYVLDNLAWGTAWDVDLTGIVAPTLLWYGDADTSCPPRQGQWYADRIRGAKVEVFAGDGHLDMVDGHWPQALAAILDAWA